MKQIYDPVRGGWFFASSEELIRQSWLHRMIKELSFPKEFLAVEKAVGSLPYLRQRFPQLPSRRIDILSFSKKRPHDVLSDDPSFLYPLLLIECKNGPLSDQALDQVLSYNVFIEAPYVAVVNYDQIRLCYHHQTSRFEIDRLPSFSQLMGAFHG